MLESPIAGILLSGEFLLVLGSAVATASEISARIRCSRSIQAAFDSGRPIVVPAGVRACSTFGRRRLAWLPVRVAGGLSWLRVMDESVFVFEDASKLGRPEIRVAVIRSATERSGPSFVFEDVEAAPPDFPSRPRPRVRTEAGPDHGRDRV